MAAKKLTPKQQEFCRQYLLDLNGTQAAVRSGYSEHTARQAAAENLSKPVIQAEIERLQKERSDRTALDADWVLRRLREEADERGEGSSHAARVRAIELAGKHLGMFADKHKHEHSGPEGGPIPVTVEVYIPANGRDEGDD